MRIFAFLILFTCQTASAQVDSAKKVESVQRVEQNYQGNNGVQVAQNLGEIHIEGGTVQIGINNGKVYIKYVGDPKDKVKIKIYDVKIANLTALIENYLETIDLQEKRILSDQEKLFKAEEYVRGLELERSELYKRLRNSIDPEALLKKYPLGYIVFKLDYKNEVFPYDNSLISRYDINWNVVQFTKNTDTEIELRLPDIASKEGEGAFTDAVTGGPKRVGNLGGAGIGDLLVLGEILEIQKTGIVFLVGFERRKFKFKEFKKAEEIARKTVNDFHTLYNGEKIEEIWDKSDSLFKASIDKGKFEMFIRGIKDSLGEFQSSTNIRPSVNFSKQPAIVTVRQNAIFQNNEIYEVFLISVKGNVSKLVGWNIWKSEKDAIDYEKK